MTIPRPLHDRIIVEPVEVEEKLASGLIIPESAKENPEHGVVVAVGPGRIGKSGKVVPMDVKEGDCVIFNKYAGTDREIEGRTVTFLKPGDILAVIEQ